MSADVMTEPEEAPAYGGRRLQPAHYEPEHVPVEVARYAGVPDMLPTGSPGKVGILELAFARTDNGTELVAHYQKSPLQIMRPLYYDPLRQDMPYVYLMSTGAGILQGDRLRTDLAFGPGTSAHVTTTAQTRVLRMEQDYAVAQVNIDAAEHAYLEYLPEPVVLFRDSRLYQRTSLTVAESATVVVGETLVAGRLARGERHRYAALAADLEIRRPDGTCLAVDRVRLTPTEQGTGGLAVLDDHDVLAMLYVVTPLASAADLADLLHAELAGAEDVVLGVSALPGEVGVWVRILGDATTPVARASALAWRALRLRLTGRPAPVVRKT
ncbi:urease accessory protein UreD [Cellulomonas chengniuliangii]|uniref:urease accessory protein UreD n=1 Tax=Cellulomonas chengniuliangii TaxID=2968084 RepID=UPI001D0EE4D3|nr:urease accessory protein UreD [Cellulomonas chengniuliangii]MCC2318675.1 urease accessory protein UreD [Cellulomonas chengniuliangii]